MNMPEINNKTVNAIDDRLFVKIPRRVKYEKIFPQCSYTLHFDGCSKGNPGPSGIGAVIYKGEQEIWSKSEYIGDDKTNNQAEYLALIMGLSNAISSGIEQIYVFGDSQLVINQINNVYKVKNRSLFELYEKVSYLKQRFKYIEFNHVYREENKRADELANNAFKLWYNNLNNISDEIYEDIDKRSNKLKLPYL